MSRETEAPKRLKTRWQHLALVCRDCQGRRNGPDDLKAKRVARRLREQLEAAEVPARVLLVRCVGLCPRGAMIVALPDREGRQGVWALRSIEQLRQIDGAAPRHAATAPCEAPGLPQCAPPDADAPDAGSGPAAPKPRRA